MAGLNSLKVFSDYTKGSLTETLQQQVEIFNGATGGAITLVAKANDGDYHDTSFWKKMSGLVRRRNAYGAGAVTAIDLEQLQATSVKVAAGTPPVNIPPSRMTWILKDPKEQGVVFGQQLALEQMADMLNVGIAAGRAALVTVGPATFYDGTAANLSWLAMNSGASKFGDKAQRIGVWVTHSKPVFDLWAGNLGNDAQLFTFGSVNVIKDPWGRPIVMTDSPDLIDPTGIGAGPDVPSYFTMGLVPGAIMIEDNGDYRQNISETNGDENIQSTIQAEWTYNVSVRGFSWDKSTGGKSPTTSALATGANWDQVATSVKDLAGVILETK